MEGGCKAEFIPTFVGRLSATIPAAKKFTLLEGVRGRFASLIVMIYQS
jgi:hypothetical protein